MLLQFFLLLLLSWQTALTSSSTTVLPQAKPGCQANCGDFAVTYPFGIGPIENGCSLIVDDLLFYNVTCDTSYHPPKPFLRLGTNLTTGIPHMIELTSIAESELRVRIAPSTVCYQNETANVPAHTIYNIINQKHIFGLGCNSLAHLYTPYKEFSQMCSTKCETKESIIDGSSVQQTSKINTSFSPCSYAFISEKDKYKFKASDLDGASFRTKGSNIPVVLDWSISNKTNCRNSDKSTPGYTCTCNTGFVGNPYLSPGCQ
ncbi:hypothetical protein MKW92_053251, partial [Papaver armeniacum]